MRPFAKLFGPPENQVLVLLDEAEPAVTIQFVDLLGEVCALVVHMPATTSGELAARICFQGMTETRARVLIEQALTTEKETPDHDPAANPRTH